MKLIIHPVLLLIACTPIAHAQPLQHPSAIHSSRLWTQFAQGPQHHARSNTPLPDLETPLWVSSGDGSIELSFLPQSGIVADDDRVYALGFDLHDPVDDLIAAFDQRTGQLLWTAPVPFAILDSWSTPAIDPINETIIVASGSYLTAIDTITGTQRWQTPLDRPIVNASPVITHDLRETNRLFITDYSFGSGFPGQLYCINLDPNDPIDNPYDPGERVWTVLLDGDTSGNTPAYAHGGVFVSTANSATNQGTIARYDAHAIITPSPDWTTLNPEPFGFYAGVSLADGHVYSASYNFAGAQHSANTIKLHANTGDVQWSSPSTRTDIAPAVLPDGRVLISGGVQSGASSFSGSIPSILMLDNAGGHLWDSALATHVDSNSNGVHDHGETYLSIGGWTHQPAITIRDGQSFLTVGTLADPDSAGYFAPCTDLRIINLDAHPTSPRFIQAHRTGVGSTPAITNSLLFSVGADGIHAFAPGSTRDAHTHPPRTRRRPDR